MTIHVSDTISLEFRLTDSKNIIIKPSQVSASLFIRQPVTGTVVEKTLSSLDPIVDEWFVYKTQVNDFVEAGIVSLQIKILSGTNQNRSEIIKMIVGEKLDA